MNMLHNYTDVINFCTYVSYKITIELSTVTCIVDSDTIIFQHCYIQYDSWVALLHSPQCLQHFCCIQAV
jgi:hypothetical protein